jgi:hypothetical protein
LKGLGIKNVDFIAIGICILQPLGKCYVDLAYVFCSHLIFVSNFDLLYKNIWQPCLSLVSVRQKFQFE